MPFQDKVFEIVSQIPEGRVTTYKLVAQKLNTSAYRAVGQALKKNINLEVPCHRVIKSSGELGGFRGNQTAAKARLLKGEGIEIRGNRIELDRYLWKA